MTAVCIAPSLAVASARSVVALAAAQAREEAMELGPTVHRLRGWDVRVLETDRMPSHEGPHHGDLVGALPGRRPRDEPLVASADERATSQDDRRSARVVEPELAGRQEPPVTARTLERLGEGAQAVPRERGLREPRGCAHGLRASPDRVGVLERLLGQARVGRRGEWAEVRGLALGLADDAQ